MWTVVRQHLVKQSAIQRWCMKGADGLKTELILNRVFANFFKEDKVNVEYIQTELSRCNFPEEIIKFRDVDDYNLLQKAVLFNCVELVQAIIQFQCLEEPEDDDIQGRPLGKMLVDDPFHIACSLGYVQIAELLLDAGIRVNQTGCLTLRPPNAPVECVPEIYSKQIQPMQFWHQNREGAYFAVIYDHPDILKLILKKCGRKSETPVQEQSDKSEQTVNGRTHRRNTGYNVENILSCDGPTPLIKEREDELLSPYLLHVACYLGRGRCIDILMKLFPMSAMNFNCPDQYGDGFMYKNTPLSVAIRHHPDVLRVIMENGMDTALLSITQALHVHFWNLSTSPYPRCMYAVEMTKLLIQLGIDINLPDNHGQTALHVLLETVNYTPIVDTDPGSLHYTGQLYTCLKSFDDIILECTQLVLEAGSDLDIRDLEDQTPLIKLLRNDRHFLRYGMSQVFKDDTNISAEAKHYIFGAQCYGLEQLCRVVEMLVKCGADVNRLGHDGTSPLYAFLKTVIDNGSGDSLRRLNLITSEQGQQHFLAIIMTLLEAGANPNALPRREKPLVLLMLGFLEQMVVEIIGGHDDQTVHDLLALAKAVATICEILMKYSCKTKCLFPGISVTAFDYVAKILSHTKQSHPQTGALESEQNQEGQNKQKTAIENNTDHQSGMVMYANNSVNNEPATDENQTLQPRYVRTVLDIVCTLTITLLRWSVDPGLLQMNPALNTPNISHFKNTFFYAFICSGVESPALSQIPTYPRLLQILWKKTPQQEVFRILDQVQHYRESLDLPHNVHREEFLMKLQYMRETPKTLADLSVDVLTINCQQKLAKCLDQLELPEHIQDIILLNVC